MALIVTYAVARTIVFVVVGCVQVLQTLGKADKSTDETFDDLVQKTEKQHVSMTVKSLLRSSSLAIHLFSLPSLFVTTALPLLLLLLLSPPPPSLSLTHAHTKKGRGRK